MKTTAIAVALIGVNRFAVVLIKPSHSYNHLGDLISGLANKLMLPVMANPDCDGYSISMSETADTGLVQCKSCWHNNHTQRNWLSDHNRIYSKILLQSIGCYRSRTSLEPKRLFSVQSISSSIRQEMYDCLQAALVVCGDHKLLAKG